MDNNDWYKEWIAYPGSSASREKATINLVVAALYWYNNFKYQRAEVLEERLEAAIEEFEASFTKDDLQQFMEDHDER